VVEFAIAVPMLLILVMGLIDVGRYMYYSIVATHAARAAVQYGAQNVVTAANTTAMTTAANNDASGLSNLLVTPGYACMKSLEPVQCAAMDSQAIPAGTVYYVTATVTGTFSPMLPYPGIPQNVPVTGSAQMRVEQQ
jgi:Flp pilus assembly protein TadG